MWGQRPFRIGSRGGGVRLGVKRERSLGYEKSQEGFSLKKTRHVIGYAFEEGPSELLAGKWGGGSSGRSTVARRGLMAPKPGFT